MSYTRYKDISQDIKDYVRDHADTMSDTQIAQKLKISSHIVKVVRLALGIKKARYCRGRQLCWDCDNATDFHKCSWVDTFTYPEGVALESGLIVSCPNFILDKKLEGVKDESK